MAKLKKNPYKGTRDFFPDQMRIRDYIFKKIHEVAQSFGYRHYDGPLLEELELYQAKSGQEIVNEQVYSFIDKGKRSVAIRPEMTPTLARMVAQIYREVPMPLRWYSIPNLMRYESPQKGRLREHWQFNCDIFGAHSPQGESEILLLLISLLESFGANSTHFEILINDRKLIDTLFQKTLNIDEDKSYSLYKILDQSRKIGPTKLKEAIDSLNFDQGQRTILESYLSVSSFSELENFVESKMQEAPSDFSIFNILSFFKSINYHQYLSYAPYIVRGLDYYTGAIFEVFDKNKANPRAICGGGSYANLVGLFDSNASLEGVGLGLGDVTLKDFLETHKLLPEHIKSPQVHYYFSYENKDFYPVLSEQALKLRRKGKQVLCSDRPQKIKKALQIAQKEGALFLGHIGQKEWDQQKVQIKNLKTREQEEYFIKDLALL